MHIKEPIVGHFYKITLLSGHWDLIRYVGIESNFTQNSYAVADVLFSTNGVPKTMEFYTNLINTTSVWEEITHREVMLYMLEN